MRRRAQGRCRAGRPAPFRAGATVDLAHVRCVPGADVDEQAKKEIKEVLVKYDRTLLVADPRRCEPKKCGPGLPAPAALSITGCSLSCWGSHSQGWFYQRAVLGTATSVGRVLLSLTSRACVGCSWRVELPREHLGDVRGIAHLQRFQHMLHPSIFFSAVTVFLSLLRFGGPGARARFQKSYR